MSQVKEPGLIPGKVTPQHFDALLSFTGIRGEVLVAALRGHFVDGLSQRDAIQQTGVNQSLLSRRVHAEIRGNFTHSRSNCLIPK